MPKLLILQRTLIAHAMCEAKLGLCAYLKGNKTINLNMT